MSEFIPIELRYLDNLLTPLSADNIFPISYGNEDDGYELRSANVSDVLDYVKLNTQDSFINTLNINNSAVIQNFLNIGQVQSDLGYKLYVDGNVLISGSISALSTVNFFTTSISSASSMWLTGASSVCLKVNQPFNFPIAQFYDGNNISLHVDGTDVRAGNVGIKTITPNESLTVVGNISSSNAIYTYYLNSRETTTTKLTSDDILVKNNTILGQSSASNTNIGNLSSSLVKITGNVFINAVSSLSTSDTFIGHVDSDVYVNGYLFTKDISSDGSIYINKNSSNYFSLGNLSAVNSIEGNTAISGNVYIDGNVVINSDDSDSTYLNNGSNTGNIYLGNPLNTTNINSNKYTINTILTSNFIYYNFTENDALTSTIEDIFNTSTVVFSSLEVNSLNDTLTSLQYKTLTNVEAENINLSNKSCIYGNNDFYVNLRSSNLDIDASNAISIKSLSGGSIDIGTSRAGTFLLGNLIGINNENDGVEKNTFINSEQSSGSVYIGNSNNTVYVESSSVNINTLSGIETNIGNLNASTNITNLNIIGGLSASTGSFSLKNVEIENLIVTSNSISLNNSELNNNLKINNTVSLSSVTFTSEIFTDVENVTATNSYIKVLVNGIYKYIRLFDL